jgi:hypothetical protein
VEEEGADLEGNETLAQRDLHKLQSIQESEDDFEVRPAAVVSTAPPNGGGGESLNFGSESESEGEVSSEEEEDDAEEGDEEIRAMYEDGSDDEEEEGGGGRRRGRYLGPPPPPVVLRALRKRQRLQQQLQRLLGRWEELSMPHSIVERKLTALMVDRLEAEVAAVADLSLALKAAAAAGAGTSFEGAGASVMDTDNALAREERESSAIVTRTVSTSGKPRIAIGTSIKQLTSNMERLLVQWEGLGSHPEMQHSVHLLLQHIHSWVGPQCALLPAAAEMNGGASRAIVGRAGNGTEYDAEEDEDVDVLSTALATPWFRRLPLLLPGSHPPPANVVAQGWLWKQSGKADAADAADADSGTDDGPSRGNGGKTQKKFKKRWFILADFNLYYYNRQPQFAVVHGKLGGGDGANYGVVGSGGSINLSKDKEKNGVANGTTNPAIIVTNATAGSGSDYNATGGPNAGPVLVWSDGSRMVDTPEVSVTNGAQLLGVVPLRELTSNRKDVQEGASSKGGRVVGKEAVPTSAIVEVELITDAERETLRSTSNNANGVFAFTVETLSRRWLLYTAQDGDRQRWLQSLRLGEELLAMQTATQAAAASVDTSRHGRRDLNLCMSQRLRKKGRVVKSWRERYFVLEAGLLQYFVPANESKEDETAAGKKKGSVVLIGRCVAVKVVSGGGEKAEAFGGNNKGIESMSEAEKAKLKAKQRSFRLRRGSKGGEEDHEFDLVVYKAGIVSVQLQLNERALIEREQGTTAKKEKKLAAAKTAKASSGTDSAGEAGDGSEIEYDGTREKALEKARAVVAVAEADIDTHLRLRAPSAEAMWCWMGALMGLWQDEQGDTALICAARNGDMQMCRLLCDFNDTCDLSTGGGGTAGYAMPSIAAGVRCGTGADLGVDLERVNKQGHSALLLAAARGHTPMVSLLLQSGANPTTSDPLGWTPLMLAALCGSASIVALLAKGGAVAVENGESAPAAPAAPRPAPEEEEERTRVKSKASNRPPPPGSAPPTPPLRPALLGRDTANEGTAVVTAAGTELPPTSVGPLFTFFQPHTGAPVSGNKYPHIVDRQQAATGVTALMVAAGARPNDWGVGYARPTAAQLRALRMLIKYGARVGIRNYFGQTAEEMAVEKGGKVEAGRTASGRGVEPAARKAAAAASWNHRVRTAVELLHSAQPRVLGLYCEDGASGKRLRPPMTEEEALVERQQQAQARRLKAAADIAGSAGRLLAAVVTTGKRANAFADNESGDTPSVVAAVTGSVVHIVVRLRGLPAPQCSFFRDGEGVTAPMTTGAGATGSGLSLRMDRARHTATNGGGSDGSHNSDFVPNGRDEYEYCLRIGAFNLLEHGGNWSCAASNCHGEVRFSGCILTGAVDVDDVLARRASSAADAEQICKGAAAATVALRERQEHKMGAGPAPSRVALVAPAPKLTSWSFKSHLANKFATHQ